MVEAKVLQSINELYKLLYKMDNMEQEIILYLFDIEKKNTLKAFEFKVTTFTCTYLERAYKKRRGKRIKKDIVFHSSLVYFTCFSMLSLHDHIEKKFS